MSHHTRLMLPSCTGLQPLRYFSEPAFHKYMYIYIVVCIDMCVSIYSICIFHYSTHASAVMCPFSGCASFSRGRDLHQPKCQNWPVSAARRLRLVGFSARRQRRSQWLPDWPDSFSEEYLQCFHQSTCKSTPTHVCHTSDLSLSLCRFVYMFVSACSRSS